MTGQTCQPTADDVVSAIETAIKSGVDTKNTEIAFFGGSFTAIDREYMISLLDATKPYIKDFYGIRCSTRPDAIDTEVLSLLKSYGVTSIELGAQSMSDRVLELNERGHTSVDVEIASKLIKENGFSLGLQMMTGMYGSNPDLDLNTARKIAKLSPDTVRVYPTITMKNTPLAHLYQSGKYVPYDEETTVQVCSNVLNLFYENKIDVIRVGLHYSDDLVNNRIAGYYHPAFREICESRIFFDLAYKKIKEYPKGKYIVFVAKGFVSKAVGQKKSNVNKFFQLGYDVKIKENPNLKDFEFIIEEEK
ncbi:MAG: radical SAM protein [Ruminococcus sp.]|nr:radical SAM protein [Ruminococcus sp.]